MRLLKREKTGLFTKSYCFSLVECNPREIPVYAILSHRWGSDEVTYQDLQKGTAKTKVGGYKKLAFCAERAAYDGLVYFWVDTCCIDRTSSAELSEAINSMFKWYRNAIKCYVYLADVSAKQNWEYAFKHSEWFSRGWTLQELLAPRVVEFFSADGKKLGDRNSLEKNICQITGISNEVLQGKPLDQIPEQERFSWAAKRETTIDEDGIYCVLGIFSVHMPLIYGEGYHNALLRLQREIQLLNNATTSNPQFQKQPEDQKDAQPPKSNTSNGVNSEYMPKVEHLTMSAIGFETLSTSQGKCNVSVVEPDRKLITQSPGANRDRTRYMSATLHCLSAVMPCMDLSQGTDFLKQNCKDTSGIMLKTFTAILQASERSNVCGIEPTTYAALRNRMDKEGILDENRDAKEFFDGVIKCLHEDLNTVCHRGALKPLPLEQIWIRETNEIPKAALIEWQRYEHNNHSLISSLFAGQHAIRFNCLICNSTNTTYEVFYSISLELPKPSFDFIPIGGIYSYLEYHTREKRIAFDKTWNCPNCKEKQDLTKQIILTRLPRCLVLHFDRFLAGTGREKESSIGYPIAFPAKGLIIDRYTTGMRSFSDTRVDSQGDSCLYEATRPPFTYDCYGVIQHQGTLIDDIPYFSIVGDKACNCETVVYQDRHYEFSWENLESHVPYMLFYRRSDPE